MENREVLFKDIVITRNEIDRMINDYADVLDIDDMSYLYQMYNYPMQQDLSQQNDLFILETRSFYENLLYVVTAFCNLAMREEL